AAGLAAGFQRDVARKQPAVAAARAAAGEAGQDGGDLRAVEFGHRRNSYTRFHLSPLAGRGRPSEARSGEGIQLSKESYPPTPTLSPTLSPQAGRGSSPSTRQQV